MRPLTRLFQALPAPVRRWSEPAKAVYSAVAKARSGVWLLSGREASSGEPLAAAFTGTEQTKAYLAKRLFSEPPLETPLRSQWRWRAAGAARGASSELSLHVTEVPWSHERHFRPGAFAYLPGWVATELELDAAGQWKTSKRFKRSRAGAEKAGLVRSVTRDPGVFAEFYRDLYLPYISARHDDAAILLPLAAARRDFIEKNQELLLLKNGAEPVAGLVYERSGAQARSWQLGIRRGDGEETRRLSDLVFYHLLLCLEELKVSSLNMGSCRPFLSDGLLDYKRSWGARLRDERSPNGGLWALTILQETPGLHGFLRRNPFVAVDGDDRFHLYAFVDRVGTPEASAALARLDEDFRVPGRFEVRAHELSPGIVPFHSPA